MAEKEYIGKVAFNYAIREAVKKYPNSFYNGLEVARQIAHDLPAADVRPVRRGKWEYNPGDNIPYCSECMMPQDGELNFCPNCGADMREEG